MKVLYTDTSISNVAKIILNKDLSRAINIYRYQISGTTADRKNNICISRYALFLTDADF